MTDNELLSVELDPSRVVGHSVEWDSWPSDAELSHGNSIVKAFTSPSLVKSRLTSSRSVVWVDIENSAGPLKFGIALTEQSMLSDFEKAQCFWGVVTGNEMASTPKIYVFDCGKVGEEPVASGDVRSEFGAVVDTDEGWVEIFVNLVLVCRFNIPKGASAEYCFSVTLSDGHKASIITDYSQCQHYTGVDLTEEDASPLISAVAHCHVECVKLLLSKGVRIRGKDNTMEQNAMGVAVAFGQVPCLRFLLEAVTESAEKYHFDINDTYSVILDDSSISIPLLHFAAIRSHIQCLQLLLEYGAFVDPDPENCPSCLHYAAIYSDECVKVLLKSGASVDLMDKYGRTPLFYAVKDKRTTISRLLLNSGAMARIADEYGDTPLSLAVRMDDIDCVNLLVEFGASIDDGALVHTATYYCSLLSLKLVLALGADVNRVDKDGETPLMAAASFSHLDCVRILLDGGANVDALMVKKFMFGSSSDETALCIAARSGCYECAKLLLDRGACVEGLSTYRTPLSIAIRSSHLDCIKLLLKYGANPNSSAVQRECKATNFENVPDIVEIMAYGFKSSRKSIFAPNWYALRNNEGKTPLHRAVEDRVLSTIPSLIAAYPRALMIKDNFGQRPFDLAAISKDPSVLWFLMPFERTFDPYTFMQAVIFVATRMSRRIIQSVHIHLLGHGYAGKTTCRKALNHTLKYLNSFKFALSGSPREVSVDRCNGSGKTEGMEMDEIESPHHKWLIRDYGGQTDFHVNHARFLSVPGSVYVIVVALWDEEKQKPFIVEEVKNRYLYWLKFLNSVSNITVTLSCITIINFTEKVGKNFTTECVAAIKCCMSDWDDERSHVKLYGEPCVLSVNKVGEVRKLNDMMIGAANMSEEVNSFPIMSYIQAIEDSFSENVRKMHGKLADKSIFIDTVCKPAICKLFSADSIPADALGVDFVCEKMIEYLISVGSIIIVATTTSEPLVVLDVNWLSSELLGSLINRMTSSGNAEYVLTASQINSFTNNGGKYFGGVDGLVSFLESIGACIIVKDGDRSEAKRWFPLCSQRKFIVGKECIPMEKGMWVSFRKAVRLFTLSDSSHQMFPPGYFLDLFLKILSLFSMKNATTVKVFINGFEVEYQFADAVLQVLIIALDDNCGFTVEVSLVSELNSPNRVECWKRFNRICDVILNAKDNIALKDMIRVSPWFNNVKLTEMFVNPKETANKDSARDGNREVRELRNTKSLEDLKELDESVQNLYIYGCNERDMPVDEKDPPKHILEALFSKVNEMQQFLAERWNTVTVTVSSDMIEDAFRGMMKTLQGSVSEEIQTMMETTRQALTADTLTADTLTVSDLTSALDKMKNEISVSSSSDKAEVLNELKLIQDSMTELTSEVKSIQQLNDKQLQESILRAMEECKTLHKLDNMMQTMLKGTHDIPTMAIVIPVGDPSMFNPSNWTSNEYALLFVCTHTHQVVPCGPEGKGYKFRRAKDWFKKVAPVIKVCLIAAKIALTVTGIPIPINGATKSLDEMSGAVSTSTQYLNSALNFVDAANKAADGLGIAVGSAGSGVDNTSVDGAEQYVKSLDDLLEQSDTVEAYKSLKALLDEVDPSLSSVGVERVTSSSGVTGWVKKGDRAVIDSFMTDAKWPMKIAELKESYNAVAGTGAADASSKAAGGSQSKLGVRSGLWLPKSLFGIGVGTRK